MVIKDKTLIIFRKHQKGRIPKNVWSAQRCVWFFVSWHLKFG